MLKFWSYQKEYIKNKKILLNLIDKSISSGSIFFGKNLELFEKTFTSKYNSKYGVAVGSGTDALLIALKALDIKDGDEVITAANTAIPTISAIISSNRPDVMIVNSLVDEPSGLILSRELRVSHVTANIPTILIEGLTVSATWLMVPTSADKPSSA